MRIRRRRRRIPLGPIMALVSYAASPKGRAQLGELRRRLDTPENRRKVVQAKDRVLAAQRRPKR